MAIVGFIRKNSYIMKSRSCLILHLLIIQAMTLEDIINTYGYLALFAGVLIEGEGTLIAASFAAHQGYLHLPWVIVVAFFGSIAGDQFYFFFGRIRGRKYLEAHPHQQLRVKRVQAFLRRHQRLTILSFRFLYGLRSVVPFAIGMSGVEIKNFIALNGISALAWSVLLGTFGFLLGTILEILIGDVKRNEGSVFLVILVIGIVVWTISYLHNSKALKRG